MLSDLMTRPCTLVMRDSTGTIDDDGEEVVTTTEVETVCELQQQQRNEQDDQGELSETTWRLFLPHVAATQLLRGADRVVVEAQVFELIGDPWPVRHPVTGAGSHVEATARRVAGADTPS